MLLLTVLSLCIGLTKGDQKGRLDLSETLAARVPLGQVTVNEMFREVVKLMEDTQQKLEEAVHQMINETSKSLYGDPLPFEYHIQNKTGTKETGSESGGSDSFTTLIQESSWNEIDHCLIDEDCEKDSYCLYEISRSKCVPCKSTNEECVKDEECCAEQLCVWGVCTLNKTRGQSGTICQYQSDCSPLHCCAMHKALLYPVCRPRPQERQSCRDQPNQLLDLLMWDEEAPHEHCPCAAGLECQLLGQKSVCLKQKRSNRDQN
ncbi:dickkopf-related protein 3b isoform X2 [Trichomycterus rosablanca]|uniref:dickkopf-related protein 3b isoform X2 n=1 Tax=Trichomycterus rosablanca TaxID=2290929 RepID=UPI002F35232A